MRRILLRLTVTIIVSSTGIVLLALGVGHRLIEDDIAYAAYLNNDAHIYQMSPTRHISLAVTHDRAQDTSPAWSPDGQQLAFISRQGDKYLVSVMDAFNGHARTVTDGAGDEYSPAWSPDGRYIAFVRLNGAATNLFVTDLQLGTTRHITKMTYTYYAPAWSPDGHYITFAADINTKNSTDLFKLDVQTNVISPLIETPAKETFNTWSPDGHYLLYMAKDPSTSVYLWDMQAGYSILIYRSDHLSSIPGWSSDSRYIIFSAFTENGLSGLFRMDVTNCVQRSDTCEPELLSSAYVNFLNPRWRPRTS